MLSVLITIKCTLIKSQLKTCPKKELSTQIIFYLFYQDVFQDANFTQILPENRKEEILKNSF